MAASPGPGRRGQSHASYQRRRIVAGAIGLAVVVVLVIGLLDGGGIVTDAPQSADEVIQRQRERDPVTFTVSVSGDLLIHSPVYARAQALAGGDGYDFAPMFKQVRPYVRGADLALCHVEVPMTPAPPASFPIFNTPPELADAIAKTGWEACDTASNHSLDQGQEGIDETLKALDRARVEHTGSYASKADSGRILMLGVKGVRVAYLAYTTDTNGIPLPNPWSLNVAENPDRVIADARRARKQGADVVLVNIAWGIDMTPEYVTSPSRKQIEFTRELADAPEITAVVGSGPHVVQRVDRFGGKYVVFSEGNLISNQGADVGLAAESQDGLVGLLDVVVDGDGAEVDRVRYVPTFVSHPDYTVLPVGPALEGGDGNAGELRASYQRTVDAAGRGKGVEPDPAKLP
ncbi:MAG TPA: CapA family protein [Solirubrobacterales bacterium]|nr:CapA family protein [Solirubrobacterales bacterium]